MHEFKHGQLHSGSQSGPIVKSRAQAIAIGLDEERRAGKRIPRRRGRGRGRRGAAQRKAFGGGAY